MNLPFGEKKTEKIVQLTGCAKRLEKFHGVHDPLCSVKMFETNTTKFLRTKENGTMSCSCKTTFLKEDSCWFGLDMMTLFLGE